jgi:hypothetical protein
LYSIVHTFDYNTYGHTNRFPDGHSYWHGIINGNTNGNTNGDSWFYTNRYANRFPDGYSYWHGIINGHTNGNSTHSSCFRNRLADNSWSRYWTFCNNRFAPFGTLAQYLWGFSFLY